MNIIPDRLAPVGNFFKVSDTQSAVIYHWQSRAIPINNLVTQPNDFYQVVLLLRQVSDGEIISPCQQTGSSSTVTYRIEYGAARPFLLALKGFFFGRMPKEKTSLFLPGVTHGASTTTRNKPAMQPAAVCQVSDGEITSPCWQTGSSSTMTYKIEYDAARPFLLALKGGCPKSKEGQP